MPLGNPKQKYGGKELYQDQWRAIWNLGTRRGLTKSPNKLTLFLDMPMAVAKVMKISKVDAFLPYPDNWAKDWHSAKKDLPWTSFKISCTDKAALHLAELEFAYNCWWAAVHDKKAVIPLQKEHGGYQQEQQDKDDGVDEYGSDEDSVVQDETALTKYDAQPEMFKFNTLRAEYWHHCAKFFTLYWLTHPELSRDAAYKAALQRAKQAKFKTKEDYKRLIKKIKAEYGWSLLEKPLLDMKNKIVRVNVPMGPEEEHQLVRAYIDPSHETQAFNKMFEFLDSQGIKINRDRTDNPISGMRHYLKQDKAKLKDHEHWQVSLQFFFQLEPSPAFAKKDLAKQLAWGKAIMEAEEKAMIAAMHKKNEEEKKRHAKKRNNDRRRLARAKKRKTDLEAAHQQGLQAAKAERKKLWEESPKWDESATPPGFKEGSSEWSVHAFNLFMLIRDLVDEASNGPELELKLKHYLEPTACLEYNRETVGSVCEALYIFKEEDIATREQAQSHWLTWLPFLLAQSAEQYFNCFYEILETADEKTNQYIDYWLKTIDQERSRTYMAEAVSQIRFNIVWQPLDDDKEDDQEDDGSEVTMSLEEQLAAEQLEAHMDAEATTKDAAAEGLVALMGGPTETN